MSSNLKGIRRPSVCPSLFSVQLSGPRRGVVEQPVCPSAAAAAAAASGLRGLGRGLHPPPLSRGRRGRGRRRPLRLLDDVLCAAALALELPLAAAAPNVVAGRILAALHDYLLQKNGQIFGQIIQTLFFTL